MMVRMLAAGCAVLFVAACDEMPNPNAGGAALVTVPPRVLEIAAKGQDLSAIRINSQDGCYEFRHTNVVETTYLPLRTASGNPICSRAT